MKTIITSEKAPAPIGPYSQAVKINRFVYVSGQIGLDPESGQMADDDITAETHQVMKNLGNILKEADLDYSNIIKCSIFVKNMDDFTAVNEAYGSYFDENPPARETVEVSRLPKDVNIEISCIASY